MATLENRIVMDVRDKGLTEKLRGEADKSLERATQISSSSGSAPEQRLFSYLRRNYLQVKSQIKKKTKTMEDIYIILENAICC